MMIFLKFVFLELGHFGTPKDFDYKNELLNKASMMFAISEFTCVTFISFSNIFLSGQCEELNRKKGTDEMCGLIGRMWLPVDYDRTPYKQTVFSFQVRTLLFART